MSDEQPGPESTPPPYPGAYGQEPAPPAPPAPPAYPTYDPQAQQPPQYPQYGQPQPGQPYGQPYGYPQTPYGYAPAGDPGKRPGNVTAACVITWVCCVLNLLGALLVVGLAAADNDDFFNEFMDDVDDVSRADVRAGILAIGIVLMVWTVAALIISIPAFRGRSWARMTLVISAGISVPVQLLGFAAVVPGLTAIATIVVIVLLFTGGANEWYRYQAAVRDGMSPTPPPGVTFHQ